MLYSKTKKQLVEKVDFLIEESPSEYALALTEWKEWYSTIEIILPAIPDETPVFYRAYVGGDGIFGVQMWEHDSEKNINFLLHNFLINGEDENNSNMTQIISLDDPLY